VERFGDRLGWWKKVRGDIGGFGRFLQLSGNFFDYRRMLLGEGGGFAQGPHDSGQRLFVLLAKPESCFQLGEPASIPEQGSAFRRALDGSGLPRTPAPRRRERAEVRSRWPGGRGLPARPNPNWYFRMFGPVKKYWFSTDDQTFYGEHLRLGEYGPSPTVVHVTSR
jgi:hypothetical protein